MSNDLKKSLQLKEAFAKKDQFLIGQALGYPATAVQAFIRGKSLPIDFPDVKRHPAWPFLNFRLSADHWLAELAQLGEKVALVEQVFPNLCQEIRD